MRRYHQIWSGLYFKESTKVQDWIQNLLPTFRNTHINQFAKSRLSGVDPQVALQKSLKSTIRSYQLSSKSCAYCSVPSCSFMAHNAVNYYSNFQAISYPVKVFYGKFSKYDYFPKLDQKFCQENKIFPNWTFSVFHNFLHDCQMIENIFPEKISANLFPGFQFPGKYFSKIKFFSDRQTEPFFFISFFLFSHTREWSTCSFTKPTNNRSGHPKYQYVEIWASLAYNYFTRKLFNPTHKIAKYWSCWCS